MNHNPRLLGNRYEVGEILGRGGMADVHLGRDTRLGRTVAIKMLRSDLARDPSFQARFRREAQSAAGLNHPAVVAVYDSGEDLDPLSGVNAPYIVMEYVEGRTLRELLTQGQRLPWAEALRLTSGVLAALGYSHTSGIVHRDIKPANVMLTPNGEVKVMDFGIARAIADSSATMTQTQAVIGTAQYLSPEQARGETVDARSDLYSTGCLLFELLTGRPPFVADSPVAVAYQHVGEAPTAPSSQVPELPPEVDAIVLHALVKDRNDRYQNAEDFRQDIDAVLAGQPIRTASTRSSAQGMGGATTMALSAITGGSDTGTSLLTLPPSMSEPEIPPTRRSLERPAAPNRTGLWIFLGLLIAALIGAGIIFGQASTPKTPPTATKVTTPELGGKTLAEAQKILADLGLTVGKQERKPSDSVAAGRIIDTDPVANSDLEKGQAVDLTISAGRDSTTVPNVVGQMESEAKGLLEKSGLKVGQVSEVDSTEAEKGEVVEVSPREGEEVKPGEEIDLTIASGKVEVPNVVSLTLTEASVKLTEQGFKLGTTEYRATDDGVSGVVLEQSVKGKSVARGTTIVLTVSEPKRNEPTPSETPSPTPSPGGNQTPGQPNPGGNPNGNPNNNNGNKPPGNQ